MKSFFSKKKLVSAQVCIFDLCVSISKTRFLEPVQCTKCKKEALLGNEMKVAKENLSEIWITSKYLLTELFDRFFSAVD